jgi:mannose-6-phosphate isomerase-like protein (cupin superfamily)
MNSSATPADHYAASALAERGAVLRAQAASSGVAGVALAHYGNHHTMLTYRSQSGDAEVHENYADVFVIVGGEAILVTEGRLVEAKEESPGEIRGSAVSGGKETVMAEGDVVHISAGVPHQILVSPGHELIYFVMKIKKGA